MAIPACSKARTYGLLRLSVTENPAQGAFHPGLAWKAFVDGKPSENVSALYTLAVARARTTISSPTSCRTMFHRTINNSASTILFSAGQHQADAWWS
jgi:hypothetical protein